MYYDVICKKKDNYYLIIFKEEGAFNSDMLTFNREEIKSLVECAIYAKKDINDNKSLIEGDRFTFVLQKSGYYLLSIVVSSTFCKGYSFNLQKLKMFISELRRILAEK